MIKTIGTILLICGLAAAQEANPTSQPQQQPTNAQADTTGSVPVYRVTVVERAISAINYFHRKATSVDFNGTTLEPEARGSAKVENRGSRTVIDAKFEHLQPPSRFGNEYLTYVLWAITPEGRPQNLGELLLDGSKSATNVTTDLQAFGLIVTAEPYYAVTQPSDVVVLENVVRPSMTGQIEQVNAKYELLPRGAYTTNVNPAKLEAIKDKSKVPLELLEAQNAVMLAGFAHADQYASDTYQKAQTEMQNAIGFHNHHSDSKQMYTNAREAVQDAEDARIIALRKQRQEVVQKEREAAAQREQEARAQADAAQLQAQQEATQRSRAEADRAAAEQAKADAQAAAEQARKEREEAEAARQAALQQQQQLQAQAQQAQQAAQDAAQRAQQAEAERNQMREQLREQLNAILQTRETARGLIVNMSDVLFDTGKYTLKPGAKLKLARVGGILQAHPDLRIQVEGHTDSIGSDEYNQRLSEQRAMTVRDFLVSQGVGMNNVSAQGFGKEDPVATNATAAGRQQNRRVEMVVSGESINAGVNANPAVPGTNAGTQAGAVNSTVPAAGTNTGQPGSVSTTQPAPATTPAQSGNNTKPGIANPQGTSQPNNNSNTTPTIPR